MTSRMFICGPTLNLFRAVCMPVVCIVIQNIINTAVCHIVKAEKALIIEE
jgi:hypothetical protein